MRPAARLAAVFLPLMLAAPASAQEEEEPDAPEAEEAPDAPEAEEAPEAPEAEEAPEAPVSAPQAATAPGVARARDDEGGIPLEPITVPVRRDDYTSQHAAVELRFGPYTPKIDESAATPVYSEFFGDNTRFMIGIEVDWQAWRIPHFGTLGIGVGWGYTQMSSTNVAHDDEVTGNISQTSTLNIMPFYGVGVLRIDTFARDLRVPLVPYGKLGIATAFWWVNDGIGTATSDTGIKGKDTSVGVQGAAGLMFLLDVLEPNSARAADVDIGVNNSYLFFELAVSDYGGDQMNVGANTWVTGLAFEM
jgi:hypothetical protein